MNNLADGIECHLVKKDQPDYVWHGWKHQYPLADAEKEAEAMNVLPKFEDVRKTAQTVEYKVLPVSCEILSDICTPIETMKILKNVSTHCYMLESAQTASGSGQTTRPGISARSSRIIRARDLSIFPPLPEGW